MLYNFWLSKKCLLWLSFCPLMSTTSFKLQKLVLFKRFLFPFQSLLWAHDEIAEKNFEEDYETQQLDSPPPPVFSSIQDSVRLVGIRKNKNEPLVTIKTFFLSYFIQYTFNCYFFIPFPFQPPNCLLTISSSFSFCFKHMQKIFLWCKHYQFGKWVQHAVEILASGIAIGAYPFVHQPTMCKTVEQTGLFKPW